MNTSTKRIGILFTISILLFINLSAQTSLPTQLYPTLDSKTISISETIRTHRATVFLFYSPTCPICQSETKTVQNLYSKYLKDSVAFIMIFPQKYHTKKEIKRFLKDYSIAIPAIRDERVILTKYFTATVTPEAVVLDSHSNKIYSGKIDNLFEDIGKRRTVITEEYLRDAIEAILQNKLPIISRTEPVGCILNL